MNEMIIIRGIPGSGKSSIAEEYASKGYAVLSTDDYFTDANGLYVFDGSKISIAHAWNRGRARLLLSAGILNIVIDNTNTQAWEYSTYIDLAKTHKYDVKIIRVIAVNKDGDEIQRANFYSANNRHNVPLDVITKMIARFTDDPIEEITYNKFEHIDYI